MLSGSAFVMLDLTHHYRLFYPIFYCPYSLFLFLAYIIANDKYRSLGWVFKYYYFPKGLLRLNSDSDSDIFGSPLIFLKFI